MNKNLVYQSLLAKLDEELNRHLAANKRASAGATDSETRAETKWDTCGLEASYLARGHAQQFNELAAGVQQLRGRTFPDFINRPIGKGALVEVDLGNGPKWFLLNHCGGGSRLTVDGYEIMVITPESPVGAALLGKMQGDLFSFRAESSGKILRVE
jgi:hypothetical protein